MAEVLNLFGVCFWYLELLVLTLVVAWLFEMTTVIPSEVLRTGSSWVTCYWNGESPQPLRVGFEQSMQLPENPYPHPPFLVPDSFTNNVGSSPIKKIKNVWNKLLSSPSSNQKDKQTNSNLGNYKMKKILLTAIAAVTLATTASAWQTTNFNSYGNTTSWNSFGNQGYSSGSCTSYGSTVTCYSY